MSDNSLKKLTMRLQLGLLALSLPALSRKSERSGLIDNFPRLIAHALAALYLGNRITMVRPEEQHGETPPRAPYAKQPPSFIP